MSRGIARVTLVGNLTRDPELKTLPNATVCELSVAVNGGYKDRAGNWQERASFFDVKVWGAQGENCAQYLTKGRQVAIDGRLEQARWETPDGSKRSRVEIIADTVLFVGGRDSSERPDAPEGRPTVEFEHDDIPF